MVEISLIGLGILVLFAVHHYYIGKRIKMMVRQQAMTLETLAILAQLTKLYGDNNTAYHQRASEQLRLALESFIWIIKDYQEGAVDAEEYEDVMKLGELAVKLETQSQQNNSK